MEYVNCPYCDVNFEILDAQPDGHIKCPNGHSLWYEATEDSDLVDYHVFCYPRESLADYAHQAWSSWMQYLFRRSTFNADGSVTIMPSLVDRWLRQAWTSYENLPESKKESDRVEADVIYAIVRGG